MELTLQYIVSQVFTIIMYILLASTYYLKDRKNILIVGFLSTLSIAIAYILLNAWTGVAMCIVAVVRNLNCIIDEKKNGSKSKTTKIDIVLLMLLYVITIFLTLFTYDGFLSLLSVFATMVYTYAVWQKKVIVYKFYGIPGGILWIAYNIYIMSLFGIILESVLLVFSSIGYILELRKQKNHKQKKA